MDENIALNLLEIINRMDSRLTALETCSKEVDIKAAITKTELKALKEQNAETKAQLNELTDSINELSTSVTASITSLSNALEVKMLQLESKPYKATVSMILAVVSPVVTAILITLASKLF